MNAIEIRGLTKSYKDFTLGPIDLCLPSGCIMGVIGENGAGKTTLIKLLLELIHKDGGSVRLLGRDGHEDLTLLKEDIGVVREMVGVHAGLTPLQVGKIMSKIYKNWDKAAYMSYLQRFSLPEHKKYGDFSRGMKMKLGIALALSHTPKLLLLDEATSGLDPVVRDEVLDIFMEFTRDETHSVLITSHIVSDLEKICDYIAFLHKGKLLLCEEKDALREKYGMLRCSAEELKKVDPAAVLSKRTTEYGVEAMVRWDAMPAGVAMSAPDIEQLFVVMAKGRENI